MVSSFYIVASYRKWVVVSLHSKAVTSSLIDLIWDPVNGESVTYDVYQDGKLVGSSDESNFTAQGLNENRIYQF